MFKTGQIQSPGQNSNTDIAALVRLFRHRHLPYGRALVDALQERIIQENGLIDTQIQQELRQLCSNNNEQFRSILARIMHPSPLALEDIDALYVRLYLRTQAENLSEARALQNLKILAYLALVDSHDAAELKKIILSRAGIDSGIEADYPGLVSDLSDADAAKVYNAMLEFVDESLNPITISAREFIEDGIQTPQSGQGLTNGLTNMLNQLGSMSMPSSAQAQQPGFSDSSGYAHRGLGNRGSQNSSMGSSTDYFDSLLRPSSAASLGQGQIHPWSPGGTINNTGASNLPPRVLPHRSSANAQMMTQYNNSKARSSSPFTLQGNGSDSPGIGSPYTPAFGSNNQGPSSSNQTTSNNQTSSNNPGSSSSNQTSSNNQGSSANNSGKKNFIKTKPKSNAPSW